MKNWKKSNLKNTKDAKSLNNDSLLLFSNHSKGKSGIHRSSTETCEDCSDFHTTSTESHIG